MSKAEKFISDYTSYCSNELVAVESRTGKEVISYHEWLTPEQALKAVELAREEIYEWLKKNAAKYYSETDLDSHRTECMLEKLQMFVRGKHEYIKPNIEVR